MFAQTWISTSLFLLIYSFSVLPLVVKPSRERRFYALLLINQTETRNVKRNEIKHSNFQLKGETIPSIHRFRTRNRVCSPSKRYHERRHVDSDSPEIKRNGGNGRDENAIVSRLNFWKQKVTDVLKSIADWWNETTRGSDASVLPIPRSEFRTTLRDKSGHSRAITEFSG